MTLSQRLLLAAGIVALDLVLFVLPLTAIFLAYIVLQNPPWFRRFLDDLGPPVMP